MTTPSLPTGSATLETSVLTKLTPDSAFALAMEFLNHPLAIRYRQETFSTANNQIHSPAQVLGERIARLAALLAIEAKEPGYMVMNVTEDGPRLGIIGGILLLGLRSSPYLITEAVRAQIRSVAKEDDDGALILPRHVISPTILPEPRMWWTFETGIGIDLEDGGEVTIDAQMITDGGDHILVTTIGEHLRPDEDHPISPSTGAPIGTPLVERHGIKYGATYPDDFPDPGQRRWVGSTLQFLAFLNSPFIPKEQLRLGRQERRGLARAGAEDLGDTVSFIMLRRAEPRHNRSDSEDPDIVAWKHRWLVSGHYRAQWYPTEQAHHVIWIAPFMKGPADAPLLEHAYKVAR